MSHGSIEKCEPNLIPMLDMVLQLVMFFMLCANFASEDVNASIKLPRAVQAKPLDKSEQYVVYLNLDEKGHVLLPKSRNAGDDTLTNSRQVRGYMEVKRAGDQARIEAAQKRGAKEPPKVSLVVVRAHKDCTFKQVNDVLLACRDAGYNDIQLRARVAGAP